jgi:hypothetical protein
MNETPAVKSPTIRQHQRQLFWQILLPMLLVALIGLAAGGLVTWATFANKGDARLWADISVIWLLAPMLLVALVAAIAVGGLIYGVARLTKATPRLTARLQELVESGAKGFRRIADGTTKPFVWVEQAGAVFKSAIRLLLGRK